MFYKQRLLYAVSLLGFDLSKHKRKQVSKGVVQNQVGTESLSKFIDH